MRIATLIFCMAILCNVDPNQKTIEPKSDNPSTRNFKWNNYDLWRKKLRTEMPAQSIENLFGKPLVKIENSDNAEWYFQFKPKYEVVKTKKGDSVELIKPSVGMIKFKSKFNSGRPLYFVENWSEPDWNKIEKSELPDRQNKKYKKIPQKWEKKDNWKKITLGMPDQFVRKLLGDPQKVDVHADRTVSGRNIADQIYRYCPDKGEIGSVYFMSNKVSHWNEPFWPEIEKTLYEVVPE